jgi:hypothetical protein
MALGHSVRDAIGLLYKVLPTAVLAAAMRPSIVKRDLETRADDILAVLRDSGANLDVRSGREAIDRGTPLLEERGVIHVDRNGRFRVRERTVLRYYARTLQHLLSAPRGGRTH